VRGRHGSHTIELERKGWNLPVVRTSASCEGLDAASTGLCRLRVVVLVTSDEDVALATAYVLHP